MCLPAVSGVIILNTGFHVFELVNDSEHVEHLAEREQVALADEFAPPLRLAQPPHLFAKAANRFLLQHACKNAMRFNEPQKESYLEVH